MNRLSGPLSADQPDQIEITVPPSLERRRLRAYIAMLLIDLILLHLGFALAAFAYEGFWWEGRAILAAQALLPIFFTIALYNSSYCARALIDWPYAMRKLFVALVISAALINFVAFYTKSNAVFSRVSISLGLVFAFALMALSRWLITYVIMRFFNGKIRNRLIIQDGGPSFELENSKIVVAQDLELDPSNHDPIMLDRLGKLLRHQDKVVVSCPAERRGEWAFLLKSAGIHGEIVSEHAHRLGAVNVQLYDDQDRSTLVVSAGPLGIRARAAKRLFDIVVAALGLIILSPILIITAVLIKMEDGGPAFFTQQRLGRGNQLFKMVKFRSMREERSDEDGTRSTARDDERITWIGAFIRANSIDELPQLWNVLRGDMSIVGPRPHALGSRANNKFFWEVDGQYWRRHSLKPGLTGLAQVRGHRGATEIESDLTNRLQSDLEYIARWSLLHDIEIVFQTLLVLRHDRAF
ncbi:MAG: sugar transferase [Erythrobacter sp.]